MIKQLLQAAAALAVTVGCAFAQVEVNKADMAALDGLKGIGPAKSKAILDERAKGEFKDWSDLETRVKGIGGKSAVKLSEAGLLVNGKAKDGAAKAMPAAATTGGAKAMPAVAEKKAAASK